MTDDAPDPVGPNGLIRAYVGAVPTQDPSADPSQADAPDTARIGPTQLRQELAMMIDKGATESDLDAYVIAHGYRPSEMATAANAAVAPVQTVDVPASSATLDGAPHAATMTALKGLAKGVAFPLDLATNAIGKGAGALANMLGFPDTGAALSHPWTIGGALDSVDPTPANQRWIDSLYQGVGGAISGVGIGKAMAAGAPAVGAPSVSQGVGQVLASNPGAQAIGGGAGGLASYGAGAAGAGPLGQLGAGIAAGVLAPGAAVGAGAGLRAAIDPVTASYAEQGASQLLRQGATDPVAAARNIRAQNPATVSGALPTTAEVAHDEGLAALQRSLGAISGRGQGELVARQQQNMLARSRAADAAFGGGNTDALVAASHAQGDALDAGTRAAVSRVGQLIPSDVSGDRLREALGARAAAARSAASKLYHDLPGGDEPLQVGLIDMANHSLDGLPEPSANAPAADEAREGFINQAVRGAKTPLPRAPQTLMSWIKSLGGIHPNIRERGEFDAMGITPRSRPGFFNAANSADLTTAARMSGKKGGITSLDGLYKSAREEGFFPMDEDPNHPDQGDPRELLDALREETHGSPRYRIEDYAVVQHRQAAQAERDYWGQAFDSRGLDPAKMTNEQWDRLYSELAPPKEPDYTGQLTKADAKARAGTGPGTSISPVQQAVLELRSRFFGDDPVEGAIGKQVRKIVGADVATTADVERVSRNLRQAAGVAPTPTHRAFANAAADAVDGFLRAAAPPERLAALKEAQRAWREQATTYGMAEPGKALATDQYGNHTLDSGKVPQTLVPAGVTGETAARRLATAAGPDVAESAAREEVRRALEAAGTNRAAVDAVSSRYAPTLAAHPALARDVAAAGDHAALAEQFGRSRFGALRDSSVTPSERISQALRAKDDGMSLRGIRHAVLGNPAAEAGLRRALADHIEGERITANITAAGDSVPSNLATLKALDRVLTKTQGSGILTGQQRGVLINIRRELKRQQFASSAGRAPGSDTAMNAGVAGRIAKIALHGVSHGAGKAATVLESVIGALGNASGIRELAHEAMLDPQLAARLLEAPTPQRLAAARSRITAIGRGALAGSLANEKANP